MRWATRPGVRVDRAAYAKVSRRFVDPDAEFVFVEDPADVPADATPFDMRGVELSTATATAVSRQSCATSGSRIRCCGRSPGWSMRPTSPMNATTNRPGQST